MKILATGLFIILLYSNCYTQTTAIFDFELGKPVSVKECNKDRLGYKRTNNQCYQRRNYKDSSILNNDFITIHYQFNDKPELIKGSQIDVLILESKIESVSFTTSGINDTQIILDKLKSKYGSSRTITTEKRTTGLGIDFDYVIAEWKLKDLIVRYTNAVGSINSGIVLVITTKGKEYIDKQAIHYKKM